MIKSLHDQVTVSLSTVYYAIEYGMNRISYASADSADLAREHWDKFPAHVQALIRRDAEDVNPANRYLWIWLLGPMEKE